MFTGEFYSPQRWWDFRQYVSITLGGHSRIDDSVKLSVRWKLITVKIHFSTAVASVHDLILKLSSPLGSYFNTKLLSQAINGVQDIFLHFSEPLDMQSDDTLFFSTGLSIIVANVAGIEVNGWAVKES